MCGIAGYLYPNQVVNEIKPNLNEAKSLLDHRGPDDHGFYYDLNKSLGLTHTRLSILDISSAGHQPMISQCQNAVIIFNGEIYNFREIKDFLSINQKINWVGDSDTEVLLNLYLFTENNNQSFNSFLGRLKGIFSIAIWDRKKRKLLIARDHFGVKPLYYFLNSSGIAFASEIKALLPLLPKKRIIDDTLFRDLDLESINRYLTYLWCPGEGTPLKSVKKLSPGKFISINNDFKSSETNWYSLPQFSHINPKLKESKSQILVKTESLLRKAVHSQLISDVPLGAFLSGGLDSSSIVNFAREKISDISCFSIELKGTSKEGMTDDLPYAKMVANHLEVPLEIISVEPELMTSSLEKMVWQLDEPLADPAALNVFYISQLAKENGIKVLLSGAGGDDIFTGYRRHMAINNEFIWDWLPQKFRKGMHKLSLNLPVDISYFRRIRKAFSGAHMNRTNRLLNYFSWIEKEDLMKLYSDEFKNSISKFRAELPMMDFINDLPIKTNQIDKVLSLEQRFFLCDHNLNYTDKMSMATGIEVRVPFLDLDLVDFVSRIPSNYKQRGKEGKWILKKIMEPYLPNEVIYRPKSGFGVPLRHWLRFELEEWLNETLSVKRLQSRGLFDAKAVHNLISENKAGRIDATYTLFSLASIEIWCQYFL